MSEEKEEKLETVPGTESADPGSGGSDAGRK